MIHTNAHKCQTVNIICCFFMKLEDQLADGLLFGTVLVCFLFDLDGFFIMHVIKRTRHL